MLGRRSECVIYLQELSHLSGWVWCTNICSNFCRLIHLMWAENLKQRTSVLLKSHGHSPERLWGHVGLCY